MDVPSSDGRWREEAGSGRACSIDRFLGGVPDPNRPVRSLSACLWTCSSSRFRCVPARCATPGLRPPRLLRGLGANDYRAVQIWGFDGNGSHNDCDPRESPADPPSLGSPDWPHPLSHANTLAQAKRLSAKPVMVTASYRTTDGGFTSHVIRATSRVEFHYDDPNPQPGDTAAAIEPGLAGDRWNAMRPRFARSTVRTNGGTSSAWHSRIRRPLIHATGHRHNMHDRAFTAGLSRGQRASRRSPFCVSELPIAEAAAAAPIGGCECAWLEYLFEAAATGSQPWGAGWSTGAVSSS